MAWFRDGPIPLRFQGGVARSAGVVSKRSRSFLICPRSDPYFLLETTNHPVCAAMERGLFIRGAATPPLKGGEWNRLATNHSPSAPNRNLWDSSDHHRPRLQKMRKAHLLRENGFLDAVAAQGLKSCGNAVEGQINDWNRVERDQLAEDESTDDRDTQRAP